MTHESTPAIERGAAALRGEMNVCGDDRKCQCEDAMAISREIAELVADDLLDIEEMARALYEHDPMNVVVGAASQVVTLTWERVSDVDRTYYTDMAAALRASILGAGR